MARIISTADTAKLVRKALKAAFPKVKFSVRSEMFSGGCAIDIKWIDGPTEKQVEAVAYRYRGASFDSSIDLKSYHDSELDGEAVYFCADYITCIRAFSVEFLKRRAERVSEKYGVAVVEVKSTKYDCPEIINNMEMIGNLLVCDFVMREAHKTAQA